MSYQQSGSEAELLPKTRIIARNRVKSRTGCLRCKQRRIKCDETAPSCNQCTRRGFECPGYKRPMRWSSKYQVISETTQGEEILDSRHIPGFINEAKKFEAALTPLEAQREGCRNKTPINVETQTFFESATESRANRENNAVQGSKGGENSNNFLREASFSATVNDTALDSGLQLAQGDLDDLLVEWPEPPMAIPPALEDQNSLLSQHYFESVCNFNSCFDSPKNMFRVTVSTLMASCPLIYSCVLSMSAAHIANRRRDMLTAALEHRTEAIASLKHQLTKTKGDNNQSIGRSINEGIEALLGCIMLGMSDSWHNPALLGTTHLYGARTLFKRWLLNVERSPSTPVAVSCSSQTRSFIVGIISYWEALSSFVMDQPYDTTDYLSPFCDQQEADLIHPNPWTGISTPLFIYIARVGSLGRQRSLISRMGKTLSPEIEGQLQMTLIKEARQIEKAILQYESPSEVQVEETGDAVTPVSHLQTVAQIYRFAALLELYCVFPELIHTTETQPLGDSSLVDPATATQALATSILMLVSSIPQISGANVILVLPLIIAGSALQGSRSFSSNVPPCQRTQDTLWTEVLSLSHQNSINTYWREFVKTRIQALHSYIGLEVLARAVQVLECVWYRADVEALEVGNEDGQTSRKFIHWTDVMIDEKLEAIFG